MSNTAYQTFYSFKDLQQIGIEPLTGEACAYSQRVLCDVSERGLKLLSEFLGVPDLKLQPNMNSRVGEETAIGSFMLSRGVWRDLVAFYAFEVGAPAYMTQPDGSLFVLFDENLVERYATLESRHMKMVRNPVRHSTQPRVGSRNVHMATGRVM